jgi:hypothetical protein
MSMCPPYTSRRGSRGRDSMDSWILQLSMQSVPITTNVVSSNPAPSHKIM